MLCINTTVPFFWGYRYGFRLCVTLYIRFHIPYYRTAREIVAYIWSSLFIVHRKEAVYSLGLVSGFDLVLSYFYIPIDLYRKRSSSAINKCPYE